MTAFETLHPLVAGLVSLLVVLGAAFSLIGSVGLLRMKTFYERVHPPTMGTTAGMGLTIAASMLLFSVLASRLVVHDVLIAVFTLITTPVTYMLLVRAAMRRDGLVREKPVGEERQPGGDDAVEGEGSGKLGTP
jgi:multicomponent K+:H+ antiporter subunit G